jgi:dienelactone hydrolase
MFCKRLNGKSQTRLHFITERLNRSFKWLKHHFQHIGQIVTPGPHAWKGSTWGLIVAMGMFWILSIALNYITPAFIMFPVLVIILGVIAIAVIGGFYVLVLKIGIRLIKTIPLLYLWVLLGAFGLFSMINLGKAADVLIPALIIFSSLIGAAIGTLHGNWKETTRIQRVITIGGLVIGIGGFLLGSIWLIRDGSESEPIQNAALKATTQITPLNLPDPSQLGEFEVLTLSYGNGADRHRPEYADEAELVTTSVDGSVFVSGWEGTSGWLKTHYWGFDAESLPLNGHVWYPNGNGPFPLVLIVHGNHDAQDFSDPGYAYLGELMASRGFILASVDENFLNGSVLDCININLKGGLIEENDARGWLLLEHLRAWRTWNETSDNPFYQKVDMDNIALIGHSRGGEAAAIAAAFNRLPYYPDDATIAFDYNFNIRSVIAVAPCDGQYWSGGTPTALENVNYLVLQGANDADVKVFSGSRQYDRVAFTDKKYWFKSSLYIYRANHGQFNSIWGRYDSSALSACFLNVKPLLPGQQQEQIAKVYISAFLEATLHNQHGYVPMFRDYRTASAWLPDTIYLGRFADSNTRFISTYEEDINVATTTLPDGVQQGDNLTVWREQKVKLKYGKRESRAVYLGWDTEAFSNIASYSLTLPERAVSLNANSRLTFSLADANETSNPKDIRRDENTDEPAKSGEDPRSPIELTVEVTDSAGNTVRLPLSHYSLLQPQLEVQLAKGIIMNDLESSEAVFQNFEFPLSAFVEVEPGFNPVDLTTIRFIFDRTSAGVIILDDVGFRDN